MADSKALPPIIVRKKVVAHGGAHGGAWKVAYADFVTAMMALFIVLWLLSTSEKVKKAVAEYFMDPKGTAAKVGSALVGSGQSIALTKKDLEKLKEELERAIRKVPQLQKLKNQITMTITGEGLRIELLENVNGVFFESGSSKPTKSMVEVISVLSAQLGNLPNSIFVEGHTDATPYGSSSGYSNWELSTDRANETRRVMQERGVRADQVKQVRGYADQNLRNKENPRDASNRRISVIVGYDNAQLQKEIFADIPTKKGEAKGEAKPGKMESGPAKAEPAKAEPAKAEPAKAEPAKAEPAKTEASKEAPAKAAPAK